MSNESTKITAALLSDLDQARAFLTCGIGSKTKWNGYSLKREDGEYGGEDNRKPFAVVSFEDANGEKVYFRFEGYYASYDGTALERVYQVFPKEVTKIEFSR